MTDLWIATALQQIRQITDPALRGFEVEVMHIHHAADRRDDNAIRARRYFLRRGIDPATIAVSPDVIPAFMALLGEGIDLDGFLGEVLTARTVGEQIDAYLAAGDGHGPDVGFDSLRSSPHWPSLDRALRDPASFAKLMVLETFRASCPRCHMRLPLAAGEDLRLRGLASCCGRILLNRDC